MTGHRGPPNPRPKPSPRPKSGHICHLCSMYDSVWQVLCENNPNNGPISKRDIELELSTINKKLETIIDLLRRNKP